MKLTYMITAAFLLSAPAFAADLSTTKVGVDGCEVELISGSNAYQRVDAECREDIGGGAESVAGPNNTAEPGYQS